MLRRPGQPGLGCSAARPPTPPAWSTHAQQTGPVAPLEPSGVLHGLYWLTANLAADRPVLLVIDDLHWSDPASASWLMYLSRRIEGLRARAPSRRTTCRARSERPATRSACARRRVGARRARRR